MKHRFRRGAGRLLALLTVLVLLLAPGSSLAASKKKKNRGTATPAAAAAPITDAQEIADYLFAYGVLPPNFITRAEAKALGWDGKGPLSDVAPGKSLGGDKFGNREKLLPDKEGRQYYECDCYYTGGARTGDRLVYSNDGLVFYSDDGFRSFIELEPENLPDAPPPATPSPRPAATPLPRPAATPSGPIIEPQAIADYLFAYGKLPPNFITKREAQALGWDSSRNYVSDVAPGKSIGGDRFGNYEGKLPTAKGRQYYECDCYYKKGSRNAYRIIYSNDGLVYYTDDHYNTFTQMFPSGQ